MPNHVTSYITCDLFGMSCSDVMIHDDAMAPWVQDLYNNYCDVIHRDDVIFSNDYDVLHYCDIILDLLSVTSHVL